MGKYRDDGNIRMWAEFGIIGFQIPGELGAPEKKDIQADETYQFN